MRLSLAHKLSLFSASLIAITAASTITVFYISGTHSLLTNSLKQYDIHVSQEGQRLNLLLQAMTNDLKVVAQLQSIKNYAQGLSANTSKEVMRPYAVMVQHEFENLLINNHDYMQIRFIDSHGWEKIRLDRINGHLKKVAEEALQDKSTTDYFTEAIKTPPGEIYFSAINLNREHGVVTEPHVPTLRIATPVMGNGHTPLVGIVIINIAIGRHLQHIHSALGELSRYAYITNRWGSYLTHPDKELAFGFDLGKDHRIQEKLPELSPFFANGAQHYRLLPSENRSALAVAIRKISYDRINHDHFIAVAIAAPRDTVLAEEMGLIKRSAIWAITLTLLGIILALVASQRITRPLRKISNQTQQFIEQRQPILEPLAGRDEVAELGRTIKALTDKVLQSEHRLNAINATLEQRVEERSRELNESQYMLSTVLSSLPNRIYWKDINGVYMGCNKSFAEDSGYSTPDAIIGKTDQEMPWADHADYYCIGDDVVISNAVSSHNIITPIQFDGGEQRWLEHNKLPLLDSEGNVSGILGSYQDITQRYNAESELRESEERLSLSQQIAHVGTWDWDITANSLHWSDEIFKIFGLTPQQFPATYDAFLERIHADDIEAVTAAVNLSINTADTPYHIEHRIIRPNGEIRHVEEQGAVYRDENGQPNRMIGVVHDITEKKHAEQSRNEFISTVNHELRTPLTSILGSLRLILGNAVGEVPEKVTNLLNVANSNSEHLLHLINDLLDMQKIDAGMMQFHKKEIAPTSLLNDAISANQPYAAQHNVTLRLNTQNDSIPATIFADHERMIQVMNNLLSNAIKFSPAGETVTIDLCSDNKGVQISVSDRGPGVPSEFRDRLFERFYQLDSSDTRKTGGTGLGLNIARIIIHKHHGTLTYHDNPGGGSVFRISLPVSATASVVKHEG